MSGAMSRRKGSTAERAVVNYLRSNGWPHAERKGTGFPGADVAELGPGLELEVKDKQPANMRFGTWLDKLADDMAATDADMGAVIVKRRGTTDVGYWYFLQPRHLLDSLATSAGAETSLDVVKRRPDYSELCHWMDGAVGGIAFTRADFPVVEMGRPRREARDHYAVTTVAHGVRLLRQAGWGDPIEPKETPRP